jgi:methionyl-tRNA formyltransferase
MAGLRLIFMGTPDFSVPALKQLIKAGHHIVCVYSQPPRPAGRGQKARLSPVHMFAKAEGLKVRTPKSFETEGVLSEFSDLSADVAVVVAYGLILPKAALGAPKLGCINIHASLLPRWRGAAPIQRAIQAGDKKSGVTIMQMDEGLDTGNILVIQEIPLYMGINASKLHDLLSNMGANLIVSTLDSLQGGGVIPTEQPKVGVTYAAKLEKIEGRIDWSQAALKIDRLICAFSPWPGVWFKYNDERIKVFSVNTLEMVEERIPGTILDDQLTIACGEGAIQIIELQRPGKKRELAVDFLRGYPIDAGTYLKVT